MKNARPARSLFVAVASLALAFSLVSGAFAQSYDLPDSIKESGVLRIGSQETYVPAEFRQEGSDEVVGFTASIAREIGRRLGVEIQYIHAEYSALIPGLAADRFDMGSGGMSPNPDRLEAVNMVGYYQSGATFIVRAEDEGKYEDAQGFCGLVVGALQGSSTLAAAIDRENEGCAAAGKDPIVVEWFTTTPEGLQQVLLGRIEAYMPDYAQTLYIISTNPGQYSTIGDNYYLVKYPIVFTFSKDGDPRLMNAIIGTLTDMMADGTYLSILEEWGVEAGAILEPAVNSLTANQ